MIVALLAMLWMGCIGFIDDYLKIVQGKSRGLVAKWKLVGQCSFGLLLGLFLVLKPVVPADIVPATATTLPFLKYIVVHFAPWLYVLFVTTVSIGTSNAVNLTDGLDGLATGLGAIAAFAFAIFAYALGRVDLTGYLNLFYLPGAGELAVFCAALMGGCIGFLWFNAHPAQVFMGDTGSLAIGGAFGTVAILLKAEFLLLIIGGVFAAETVSVMLQTVGLQVVQADPRQGVRRQPPGLPHGAAAPPFREAWLGGDHGGDAVLHPGTVLRPHRPGNAEGALMLETWRASGREVAVVGLGRSGVAATLLLRDHAVPVYASDTGTGPRFEAWAAPLCAAGADVQLGGHDLSRIGRAVAVVVAPGVPPEVAPLEAARAAGVPIYAEVDLGFTALTRTRCVGITGTNGKTTTTSLIGHLLTAIGLRAETAGNIGRPLCDVARVSDPPGWLALELSSFQLHDSPHLRPDVAVITNLAPNHLDRYHSLEAYYGDKALLLGQRRPRLGDGDQRGRSGGGGDGGQRAGPAPPLLDQGRGRRVVRPAGPSAHAGRGAGARPPGAPSAGRP